MAGRPLEPEEVAAIQHLPPGGIAELARRLRRTYSAINQKRIRAGFAESLPNWQPADNLRVDGAVAEGGRVDEAARSIGRSPLATYRRRYRRRGGGRPAP